MNPIWNWVIHHTRHHLLMRVCPHCGNKFKVEVGQVTVAVPCPACRKSVPPAKTGS